VIEPHRGVFLAETWRMHPDLCAFISEAVYDGKLKSAKDREKQGLVLQGRGRGGAPAGERGEALAGSHGGALAGPPAASLSATGLCFVAVEHEGCTQASEEEADVVRGLVDYLTVRQWRDCEGNVGPLRLEDVLVVAPYNLQVNLLKARLPAGARVGTVDKFQGQEAPVVIVSMTTSSGEDLPRDIEFLYSKNRLNVALSRAKCVAVLVASPKLMDVRCRTVEQMGLVNTVCWVGES
jgi:uncharacterized protein